jgi:hypothetical protein
MKKLLLCCAQISGGGHVLCEGFFANFVVNYFVVLVRMCIFTANVYIFVPFRSVSANVYFYCECVHLCTIS